MKLKVILDYYEQIFQEFPDIPKSDIKRILQYGWKQLYLHNSYGCDVGLQQGKFFIYFGRLFKDSLRFFRYYKTKLKIKLRVLYKRNKIPWDGYYYFSMFKSEYDEYCALKKKRGRPRKIFKFKNVVLRKIYEECLLEDVNGVAIFRYPMMADIGALTFYPELITDKAELVTEKPTTKMKDILVSNYSYEIMKHKKYKL